jgi:hypothetical protein
MESWQMKVAVDEEEVVEPSAEVELEEPIEPQEPYAVEIDGEKAVVEPPQVETSCDESKVDEVLVEEPSGSQVEVEEQPVEPLMPSDTHNMTDWKSFEPAATRTANGHHQTNGDVDFETSPVAVKLRAELAATLSTNELLKLQTLEQSAMIHDLIGARRLEDKLDAVTKEVEVYKMTTTAQQQTIAALMEEIRSLRNKAEN